MTTSTSGSERAWLEAILEAMPLPLVLVAGASGTVTFANGAAASFAQGFYPTSGNRMPGFRCTEPEGARIPRADLPDALASRGETVRTRTLDWHTPDAVIPLIVSAAPIPALSGTEETVVVCFEDVSELRGAEHRVRAQADEIGRLYRAARDAERRKDESLALLDTLFATAPIGFGFLDRDLRYVRVNEALARINGRAAADHIGRHVSEVLPGLEDSVIENLRRVLESGEPVIEREVSGETPARPGETRHWISSHYPVLRSDGQVIGVGTVVRDVTEAKEAEQERIALLAAERHARTRAERAERRWAYLAEATALLGASLDHDEVLRRLARIVVPAKADWCALHVLAPDGRIELRTVAHVEPELAQLAWDAHARWPARLEDPRGIGAVIRTGRAEEYPEIADDRLLEIAGGNGEQLDVLRRLGFASAIVVPLQMKGRTIGSLSLVQQAGRKFDEEDPELAVELARRVAVAVENGRLYRERSEIAQTLQQSLLPPHLPDIPGFEVAARYRAAREGFEVGGDFYDVFHAAEGEWTAVVGDVCGKGAEAAALTALARHTVRAAAMVDRTPSAILASLHDAVLRADAAERFCTVACVTFAPRAEGGATLRMALGGHPQALVMRECGTVEKLGEPGLLVGLLEDPGRPDVEAELRPGDLMLLYTDGVSDVARHGSLAGTDAIAAALAECCDMDATAVAARIEELASTDGERPRDDIALLVLRAGRGAGA